MQLPGGSDTQRQVTQRRTAEAETARQGDQAPDRGSGAGALQQRQHGPQRQPRLGRGADARPALAARGRRGESTGKMERHDAGTDRQRSTDRGRRNVRSKREHAAQAASRLIRLRRGPVPVSPLRGAGRLPFWVDLIFKSAFQKKLIRLRLARIMHRPMLALE
jgi:hypothetical protein